MKSLKITALVVWTVALALFIYDQIPKWSTWHWLDSLYRTLSSPIMAHTDLSKALKQTWTEDSFKKAFDMEIQGLTLDLQDQMNRQQVHRQKYAILNSPGAMKFTEVPITVSTPNPFSYTERAARQRELMQRLAQKKKPSYRQRQKNGRAGRK